MGREIWAINDTKNVLEVKNAPPQARGKTRGAVRLDGERRAAKARRHCRHHPIFYQRFFFAGQPSRYIAVWSGFFQKNVRIIVY